MRHKTQHRINENNPKSYVYWVRVCRQVWHPRKQEHILIDRLATGVNKRYKQNICLGTDRTSPIHYFTLHPLQTLVYYPKLSEIYQLPEQRAQTFVFYLMSQILFLSPNTYYQLSISLSLSNFVLFIFDFLIR